MQSALDLFELAPPLVIPERLGPATITARQASRILAKTSGYSAAFDYTLNPYVGCAFGCAYCYAAFFVPDRQKAEEWGRWVEVKENALELLHRERSLGGKRIYVGSVTDPYQPLEGKLGLTRALLAALADLPEQPRVVLQTRSPLVVKDIDVLRRFRHLRVNVSITTDDEEIRRRFEPACPSIPQRMEALRQLNEAGLRTSACVAPLLPIRDPDAFAVTLADLRADVYVVQPFHVGRGPFSSGTRGIALRIADEEGWTPADYRRTVTTLRSHLPQLYEGREGFFPE